MWVAATLRNVPTAFLGPNRTEREQLKQRKGPLLALIGLLAFEVLSEQSRHYLLGTRFDRHDPVPTSETQPSSAW